MIRTSILLLLLLIRCLNLNAQQNELLMIGVRHLTHGTFVEMGNNYYFNTSIQGPARISGMPAFPTELWLTKCNKITYATSLKKRITGDTSVKDSALSGNMLAVYAKGVIYFTLNVFYAKDASKPVNASEGILLVAVDTNLNIVTPPVTIKKTFNPAAGKLMGCSLQAMVFKDDKLYIGYVQGTATGFYSTSACMVVDLKGHLLLDKIIGLTPDTSKNSAEHRLADIMTLNGQNALLFTGKGLIDGGLSLEGIVKTDTNLNVLDTFAFKPQSFFNAGSISGYSARFPNSVQLPTGSVVTGTGDFYVGAPARYAGYNIAAITKLSPATRFGNVTSEASWGKDSADILTAVPSIHNLVYQTWDNRVYYANSSKMTSVGNCTDTLNYILVSAADTNAHILWRKFVSPKSFSCSRVTYVASSDRRSGIDVTGIFNDPVSPTDTSLRGSFLFHIDSTGTLDAPGSRLFTVRDRFRIYPNPASETLTVDDALHAVTAASIYDLQGRAVLQTAVSINPARISLKTLPPATYLLRLNLKDGSTHSQLFIRQE